jgi:hypothetical protein
MYDSSQALETRLIDGPLTTAGSPGYITPATGFLPALDGTDGVGTNPGTGIRGWLSGIYARLANILSLTFTSGSLNVAVTSGSVSAATSTAAVAAAATAAAIKSTAGTLYGLVVSASGTVATTLTDGASGKVIAVIPANFPPGDVPIYGGGRPFSTSLYANTGAGSPAFTAIYS